jgi:hypothetical protein
MGSLGTPIIGKRLSRSGFIHAPGVASSSVLWHATANIERSEKTAQAYDIALIPSGYLSFAHPFETRGTSFAIELTTISRTNLFAPALAGPDDRHLIW